MVCIIHFIFISAEMSREPKVVVIDSTDMAQKTGFPSTSIFDDSEDDMCGMVPDEDDKPKEKKPPGPIAIFFEKNKGWLITIGVLLLTVIALSLTVYFINIKCNNTVIEERDRANRLISDLETQSGTACSDRDRYCEEAQRLRSQLRELSEEYDRLKRAPPPKAVNKLHQKKILQEYNNEDEQPRARKHKKVAFSNDDEAVELDLPKPSTRTPSREIDEPVALQPEDIGAVVTTPEEDFDEGIIDM